MINNFILNHSIIRLPIKHARKRIGNAVEPGLFHAYLHIAQQFHHFNSTILKFDFLSIKKGKPEDTNGFVIFNMNTFEAGDQPKCDLLTSQCFLQKANPGTGDSMQFIGRLAETSNPTSLSEHSRN